MDIKKLIEEAVKAYHAETGQEPNLLMLGIRAYATLKAEGLDYHVFDGMNMGNPNTPEDQDHVSVVRVPEEFLRRGVAYRRASDQ